MYAKPTMVVEGFLANNYCEDCSNKYDKPVIDETEASNIPSRKFYIDQNGDRVLQSTEMKEDQSNQYKEQFLVMGKQGYFAWDPGRSPQVGDSKPDYFCIPMRQGGESHYAAFGVQWVHLNKS